MMEETIETTDIKKISQALKIELAEKADPEANKFDPTEYDQIRMELFIHNTLSSN